MTYFIVTSLFLNSLNILRANLTRFGLTIRELPSEFETNIFVNISVPPFVFDGTFEVKTNLSIFFCV